MEQLNTDSLRSPLFFGIKPFPDAILLVVICYVIALSLYRLFLSPIAHIPGSKLAAVTGWHEVYWEVFKGGKFIHQIEKWHQRYGPIVRISPWEVHIYDADFYEELYHTKSRYSKMTYLKERFGIPLSNFDTIDHETHHRRRTAVSPFFTRQKVIDFSPYIQGRVEKLCGILQTQYKDTGNVLYAKEAWGALVADCLSWYTYALSYDFLDYPEFRSPFTSAIQEIALALPLVQYFPWVGKVLRAAPEWLVGILNPSMKAIFEFHGELRNQVRRIATGENDTHQSVKHRTVFHELLQSDLYRDGSVPEKLFYHEAASITAAGIDTTKSTLTMASFWISKKREVYDRLHKELVEAIPDTNNFPSLTELEKLPYLEAVIKESLRMSYGVSERLTRTNPHGPIQYHNYTIPANTPIGMSNYFQLRSPEVFPDPDEFIPERWLNNPVTDKGRSLNRYLVVFGRGPRSCIGMNFAYAVLTHTIAGVYRNLRFELYETERKDVDMASTFFVPFPYKGSQGVRVLVT